MTRDFVPRDRNTPLRIGGWVFPTRVLGPGLRFALWLQGCPFSCPGCTAPGFLPATGGDSVEVETVLAWVAAAPACDGVTVSGGEPIVQAEPLSVLLEGVRRLGLNVILYSGYRLGELREMGRTRPAVLRACAAADVLVDGRYEHGLNDSQGLRGSQNQRVHFLTDRLLEHRDVFESGERRQERHRLPNGEMAVGLPPLDRWRSVALDPTGRAWYDNVDFV